MAARPGLDRDHGGALPHDLEQPRLSQPLPLCYTGAKTLEGRVSMLRLPLPIGIL